MGDQRVASELADAAEPRLLGRYRYVRELGLGGMGRVLLALDTDEADAPRALKVVAAEHAERLAWERELLSHVTHPNVARVYGLLRVPGPVPAPFGLSAGSVVLVEERALGRSAAEVARALLGAARLEFVLRVGAAAARGLSALHAQRFVHGDVKPDNLVADEQGSVKLVDLGLARPFGRAPGAGGTLAYLAPEAWAGERSAGTDLYALGVSLVAMLSEDDWGASVSGPPVWGVAPRDPRTRIAALGELPPGLLALLVELLAPEPSQRSSSARDVAMRLGVMVGEAAEVSSTPSKAERVARLATLPAVGLGAHVAQLAQALDAGGLVVVAGPVGSGRDRLLREALLELELARVREGAPPLLVREVSRLPEAPAPGQVVLLRDSEGLSGAIVRAFVDASSLGPSARATLVWIRREPLAEADHALTLHPLDEEEFAQLARSASGREVDEALLRSLRQLSGGLAGRLVSLLSEAASRGASVLRPDALAALADEFSTLGPLPPEARALAEALAVAGAPLRAPSFDSRGLPALVASGAATLDADGLSLRPDLVAHVYAAMAPEHRAARARELLLQVHHEPARSFLRACVGDYDAAEVGLCAAVEGARLAGQPGLASALSQRARARLPEVGEALALAHADALRAQADYVGALARLVDVPGARARLARARVLRLTGDFAAAAVEFRACADADEPVALGASLGLARLALDRGEPDEAIAAAAAAAERAGARGFRELSAEAHETLALALASSGRLAEAAASVERGLAAARSPALRARRARLISTLGAIRAAEGRRDEAYAHAREAAALAQQAGEAHAAATFLVNLGAQELDHGRLGSARAALLDGARRLGRIGRAGDMARALYDLASLGLLCGDDALVESCGLRAAAAAQSVGDADALTFSQVALAEAARRRGQLVTSRRLMGESLRSAQGASEWVRCIALCRAALGLLPTEDPEAARELLGRAVALDVDAGLARFECARTRARLALRDGDEAEMVRAEQEVMDARPETFEARLALCLLRAELAHARGEPAAEASALAEARRLLELASTSLDGAGRARLRSMPAYQPAFAAELLLGEETVDHSLARFATVARELAATDTPAETARALLDGALALSGAERGLFLERDVTGALDVRVSRGFGGAAEQAGAYSRSVVSRALDLGQAVSSSAAPDAAFLGNAPSVHQLALRSVLGVPVLADGEAHGVLYLDDRLRPEAFGAHVTSVLEDLGVLAGLAFARHRRLRRERRARARIERLEARLARRVDRFAIELAELRPAVVDGEPWIARSAPMRALLNHVRKLATSDTPVLVCGESGVGKELVARSLHQLGARAGESFVSENCAAVSEALLETTLFGHVRGAFTGAVKDHVGLFEAADGGTLLLDEVGEMSAAMQARLLRVVQEREVRPVGATAARPVDVRLVCATHSDLRARVSEGSFREDLYYRVAVAQVDVPPLRDRPEDLPGLTERLLARHASGRTVSVSAEALRALTAFPWPGNVRQLENELRRALLLSTDAVIGLGELSAEVRGDDGADAPPSELDLRSAADALERRMIRAALKEGGGNRTRAAELLGVSRYGLSKMRKRLGID